MFKKKKAVIGLVSCLAILSLCVPFSYSEDIKSGWDYLQSDNQVKNDYVQQLPSGPKNVTKRIYKVGDLERGVLSIKAGFDIFPEEETISISLRNTDVKEVLRELARIGGRSIIIDNSVSGTVSCDLEDVSINQAMDLVLSTAELESRIVGNTIFIASQPAMQRKGMNRRFIKSIKINYGNALDIATILEASIFNKGLDISTSISETQEATPEATAMQATEVELPDYGGTTIITDDASSVVSPQTGINAAQAASSTTATGKGTVKSGGTKTINVITENVNPAKGFNDAKVLAGEIRINGMDLKSSSHSVSNNNGGTIVVPDTRTNSILIAGIEEDIHLAEQTIRTLDKPKRQVAIEVSLIELSRNDTADLGLTLSGDAKTFNGGFNAVPGTGGLLNPLPPIVAPTGSDGTVPNLPQDKYGTTDWYREAQRVGLATVAGGTALQLSTLKNLTNNIVLKINALIQKQKIKLIANPNVVVVDGAEALIKLTNQIVNRVTVTQTQTSTTSSQQLADVGIVLNVLPRISDDGYITMRIRPSVTTPGDTKQYTFGTASYEITLINTREVILQDVRVKSGETIALGGLIRENSVSTDAKVPFLGDMPLLGQLFHMKNQKKEKTELVILMTPKLIDDIGTQSSPIANNSTLVPID